MKKKIKKLIFAIAICIFLIAFGTIFYLHKGNNQFPEFAKRSKDVETAYQYAIKEPQILNKIPCYCGCYQIGHQSVENCFVKEFKKDGGVIFEKHGAYCGMCYSIVLEIKQLSQQGKNLLEIRQYIENKYSKYGRGTNTPL